MTRKHNKKKENAIKGNENKDKEIQNEETQQGENIGIGSTEGNEIKSRAIVKYSVPTPLDFIKLQCNTDLNLPPANWLSSSADSYGLQRAFTLTHRGFASFTMAQLYPDCVGDVDVISNSENIKKLLKIPYNNKELISMFVHRVGNTLLIDNFDLYKNFTRSDGLFSWLRDFVLENLSTKALQNEKRLYVQDRSREALKHRSLTSKFMYHSLDMNQSEQMIENPASQSHSPRSVEYPVLPNPAPEVEAPDPASDHKYNRNVVWTFEDIDMLLGTDMPIFGGGEYPCISLRLRDMQQPINILTGIDYWLDNLMSNVPEVVMCYHLNGIVQKYELIKTEDLPKLKTSKFSPQIIRDVAQNILSFLKANATKAGHTYWLFKDKDEDVIKLYDLTCLVPQNDKLQNPFTIPVAMLLYRVARNFMISKSKESGIIKMLLENCLKLLPIAKYPEIVTSSYYMLSEVFLPLTTHPEDPKFDVEAEAKDSRGDNKNNIETETTDTSKGADNENIDDEEEDPDEDAIKYLDLNDKNNRNSFKPPPPIKGDVEYRCLEALSKVVGGLNCLDHFDDETSEAMPMGSRMPTAKSSEPIPMGYEKLNVNKKDENENTGSGKADHLSEIKDKTEDKTDKKEDIIGAPSKKTDQSETIGMQEEKGVVKKASKSRKKKTKKKEIPTLLVLDNKKTEHLPTWKQKDVRKDGISWKKHLKILLYEKAILSFATLSEQYYRRKELENCFRNLKLLARCFLIMRKLRGTCQFVNDDCLLGRAGDCCIKIFNSFKMNADLKVICHNINSYTLIETEMIARLETDEDSFPIDTNLKCVFECSFETPEDVIKSAITCYEEALKISNTENFMKRLANAYNEAGSHKLNLAKAFMGWELGEMAKKAEHHLVQSLQIFEKVKDKGNMALLNSNMAHMYNLIYYSMEHTVSTSKRKNSLKEKALAHWDKAFAILGDRQAYPLIWDGIYWSRSTFFITDACTIQDNWSQKRFKTYQEYSQAVLSALELAWEKCDDNPKHTKYYQYMKRKAVIKYRMASVRYLIISATINPEERKRLVDLAGRDFKLAAKYFYDSSEALCYLRTQVKLEIMYEEYFEEVPDSKTTLETLNDCLKTFLHAKCMLQLIESKKTELRDEVHFMPNDSVAQYTCESVVDEFMKKLSKFLIHILKILKTDKTTKKELVDRYHECVKIVISYHTLGENRKLSEIIDILHKISTKLKF